jgi:membrane protease YdiL (CAAX protease family)
MKFLYSRLYLYLELAMLMVVLPGLLATFIPIRYMLPTMWLTALYCHIIYRAIVRASERVFWNHAAVNWQNLKPILIRFAAAAILLTLLMLWLKPELFLSFVRQSPAFWALVMVLYPLLSVVPQEIIFRSFFFNRYSTLFPSEGVVILASGLLFGAAHLVFQNWVAPVLCLAGGVMFAATYAKSRSLLLVCLEHGLYGCFIFTLGLGRYFYHGAVGPQ